ncbi:MAG: flagellar biosynthetic protein FliO [Planctomycetota bacterium]
MHSLIALLGPCLVAASAAVAADRPANPASEPWWSGPTSATSPGSGPKIVEYGTAVAADPKLNATDIAPLRPTGKGADFAPDPPGLRRSDTLPVLFQQDFVPPAETPAEKTKALEPAQSTAVKPLPPQLFATAPTASPLPPVHVPTTPPVLAPAPTSVQPESAWPLGLGSHNDRSALGKSSPIGAMITVGGSLAIVLGLFFIVAWAMRKTAPRGSLVLPKEVFEILGRAPLGARQQVQLLRCGSKLLLVSITPNGTETLTEVTDPLEVDRIAGICQQAHPKSSTLAFRQVFQQLAPKSGEPVELDNLEPAGTRRKRYRWEEKHA